MTDPYLKFWKMLCSDNAQTPAFMTKGTVVSARPAPIRVRAMGLVYEPADIQCNQDLINRLEVGDSVVCLTADAWQSVNIICKVVAV